VRLCAESCEAAADRTRRLDVDPVVRTHSSTACLTSRLSGAGRGT
jgi:hypothetical protein